MENMEMLNRIQLRGFVGSCKVTRVADTRVARVSVATDHCFKDRSGTPVIETTWHNVTAWEKEGIDLDNIGRGDMVEVTGRIRMNRYTNSDGVTCQTAEVLANELKVLDKRQ
jgi:single-strand DNA-binding protein